MTMEKDYVLALDIGTTSVKAVIFKRNGKVVAEVEKNITTHYPQPGWVEQNPQVIERHCVTAIRDVIQKANIHKTDLKAFGLASAMHSLICLDAEGEPLTDAIIWADRRSHKQADKVREMNGQHIYEKTGLRVHPMAPLAKLLWMKDTSFAPYEKATYFMSIKEYIIYKWFGQRLIDYSMAAATGLFNMETFTWDKDVLQLCGVHPEQLSDIVQPTKILPPIHEKVALEMGISRDMPIVIGAADGQLANLGSGAILPGEAAITMGTSGAIRQMVSEPKVSIDQSTFCCAFTKQHFIIGGATNNGGNTLQWIKDTLQFNGDFTEMMNEADTVAPGADGLLFHPYINGERAPLWNPKATGNFFGLTVTHKRPHLIRAVLEGVTYNLYHIHQSLERLAGRPQKIYVNGGLARSPIWLHMLADIFGQAIHVSESHHSVAWGAAWTAYVATGQVDSFADIKANIPIATIIQPDEKKHRHYKETYKQYEKITDMLQAHF